MALSYRLGNKVHDVSLVRHADETVLNINGSEYQVSLDRADNVQQLIVNGVSHEVYVAQAGDTIYVNFLGRHYELKAINPIDAASAGSEGSDVLLAPMPGIVVSLQVEVGDSVLAGQSLLTIESMKLQTAILAERDGNIAELPYQDSDTFDKGAVLVRFERQSNNDAEKPS
ncbi:MAG: biotin/lipoyl-containing protein [Pseudomonadota bacterium]